MIIVFVNLPTFPVSFIADSSLKKDRYPSCVGERKSENLLSWFNDDPSDACNTRPHNHGMGLVIAKTIL